jgi:hypothetical protein
VYILKYTTHRGHLKGELIYRCLERFLEIYLQKLFKYLGTRQSDYFPIIYIREWKLYKRAAYYSDRLLRYLNTKWITTQLEIGYKDIFRINELFLRLWRLNLPKSIIEKLIEVVRQMKETESSGEAIDHRQIRDLDDSLGDEPNGKTDELRFKVQEWIRGIKSPSQPGEAITA